MQGITFSHINTKTFNIVLCIILPLVLLACLSGYTTSLDKFDVKWLLSSEFLRMLFVLMCYTIPLTYFLSKVYELTAGNTGSSVFAFIASCVLISPLAFIALIMFAKLSFIIPIVFTLTIAFLYYRSLKRLAY